MKITEVKIRKILNNGTPVKAIVSIVLDGEFAVHDIKVMQGIERIYVAMPNSRHSDGKFHDTVHPTTQAARDEIEKAVLNAYLLRDFETSEAST